MDTAELDAIYAEANTSVDAARTPAQKLEVGLGLRTRLIDFAAARPKSAYSPSVRLEVVRLARDRLGYSDSVEQALAAFDEVKTATDPRAREMAREAATELVHLLSITSRYADQKAVEEEARALKLGPFGPRWARAVEARLLAEREPESAYKCGLYCLDLLGRLTANTRLFSDEIRDEEVTPNGLSAADLVRIGGKYGAPVRVLRVEDMDQLPLPSIVHLAAEHFVFATARSGPFIRVVDPLARHGVVYVTPAELAREASGCVLVPEASFNRISNAPRILMADAEAAGFRGKCHPPSPNTDEDQPCETCDCPPGSKDCGDDEGAAVVRVSSPFLHPWTQDQPLVQRAGAASSGPSFPLRFANHSLQQWTTFHYFAGNPMDDSGRWRAPWESRAIFTSGGAVLSVNLPGGGAAGFEFPLDDFGERTSNTSFNYRSRYSAELLDFPEGGGPPQQLRLTRPDGSYLRYEFRDDSLDHYRLVAIGGADGTEHRVGYDGSARASVLTMADGLQVTVTYDLLPDGPVRPISMSASDGRQVVFGYGERADTFPINQWNLTSITDPSGVRSEFNYVEDPELFTPIIQEVLTPYGKTTIEFEYPASGYVAKLVKVTRPDGSVEAWARLTENADYPPFAAVPQVNTNSLDTLERGARNTVHWNVQQYAAISSTSPTNWNYNHFVRGTTRHWLAVSGAEPTHFDTLSWEQLPSPTGLTNNPGAVTWYDYDGKPTDANGVIRHERGTNSVMPSLIARLMPDGTTWSQTFVRNAVGNPLSTIERWHDGTSYQTRTQTWTYDTSGMLATSHVDALGRTNSFQYTSGRLTRQVNPLGEAVDWSHDSVGRVTERTMPSGQRFATSYSASTSAGQTNGWTVTTVEFFGTNAVSTNVVVEAWNVTLPWTYRGGVSSNIATVRVVATDSRGLITTNFSDGLGRLVESRSSSGTVRFHHELRPGSSYPEGTGTLILDRTLIESPLGITNETIHDARRRPIYAVDTHGVTNATSYCECGSPAQVTAALGLTGLARTTSFDYDNQGRLWRTTLPAGSILTNYYDVSGRLVVLQDPFGFVTNVYDNLNRLVARYGAAGLVLSNRFDAGDRSVVQTDAAGVTITNSFDGLGRLRTLHRAGGTNPILAYGYTFGFAAPTAETNAVGSVRTMQFDPGQRLTTEVQVGLWTNSFAYLPAGDLKHLDDGRGNRTEWKYDAFGRVREKWYQGQTNADLVYSYDAVGRLTNRFSRTDNPGSNGYHTLYAYNRVGGLTNVTSPTYSGNVARAYGYDALGRLTNMVDAVGTTTYSYTLGTGGAEVVTEDGPWASDTVTVTNRHRLRSHLVIGQPAGSFATTYGWDAARRMTNVTAGGQGFGYTYLGAGGQIARVSLPGGSTITNTFDSVGRHTSTALRTSGGTNLNLHGYVYDAADRRTRISRTNSANTSWNGYASFGYDAAGQLVRAQTTNAAGSEVTSERFGYVYDASQNLRWRTNNTSVTGFTNNALNQLTSLNSTTRTHDRRGNLISNVQSGETLLYSWDDESQLTSVRVDPASSPAFQPWRIDFVYDGLRRLRRTLQFTWNGSAWTSQGEIRYLYDGMLIVQERNSSNTPQVHYSRGLDLSGTIHGAGGIGGLLMRSHGYSAGNWSSHNAYHSDANGNVTALVNNSGALQASYKYNPYGGLISSSGTLAAANTMRFSSKPAIFSSSGAWGFYYYGYRFYDPVNQRWLNRDPLGEAGGFNAYGYSLGDPLNRVDLLGMVGVRFGGVHIGVGDPTYDFDDVDWNGYWGDVGDTMIGELKGAGANLSFGLYSPCYRNDLQRQGGAVGDGLVTAAQLATGAGAAAQGIARGGFKMSVKSAYKHAKNPKIPVSMAWENVRKRMLKRKFIAPNEPVHHWLFHQAGRVPDSIKNLPFNLMPIGDAAHKLAHHGNLAQKLWYGTPRWAKEAFGGLGSAVASHGGRLLLEPCEERATTGTP